jgi:hypothetical protein
MSHLPSGQHFWESTFGVDEQRRPIGPKFHRLLMLDVISRPTSRDVEHLESALSNLEERLPYGPAGLLTCLGWGSGWFERYASIPSPIPRPLPMAAWENPILEDVDACLHLASDDEKMLEQVTSELFGPGPLDQRGVLRPRETRTGFTGAGLPAHRVPKAHIPTHSPLLMGFHSGLRGNQASESSITIPDGPVAGGTTMHVSRIVLDVDAWYTHDSEHRAALMFSPTTSAAAADGFDDDAPSDADRLPAHAAVHGMVGHAQAAGRARLYGRPRINRRDFATIDHGQPGTHFVSLQRRLEDFNATRAVMNAADARGHSPHIGARRNNGLNAFLDVRTRATFAVPPRANRAYPYLAADRP